MVLRKWMSRAQNVKEINGKMQTIVFKHSKSEHNLRKDPYSKIIFKTIIIKKDKKKRKKRKEECNVIGIIKDRCIHSFVAYPVWKKICLQINFDRIEVYFHWNLKISLNQYYQMEIRSKNGLFVCRLQTNKTWC